MSSGMQDNPLSPALESVCRLLRQKDVQGMIIGGLAASLLGRPRFTNDIDLIILDLDGRIPEFMNIFKSISQRPVDIEDIKAIRARHPDIDVERILSTVRDFADILEMPQLYQKIDSLLKYNT